MEIVLQEGDTVRITALLWHGQYGRVAYVGADRVEVAFDDGAVIPFLPSEVEPADNPRWVYAE